MMHVDLLLNTASTMRYQDKVAMPQHPQQQPHYVAQSRSLPSLTTQGQHGCCDAWSLPQPTAHESQRYHHHHYDLPPPSMSPPSAYSIMYTSPQYEAKHNPNTPPSRFPPTLHQPPTLTLAPLHISTDVKPLPSLHESISTPMAWTSHHHSWRVLPSIHIKEEPVARSPAVSMFSSVINASAIQRRLAIERRNLKRKIVPRRHHSTWPDKNSCSPIIVDVKNTKNRESAAAYREKRDRKMKVILAEIHRIQAAHPSVAFDDWIPAKLPKSERHEGESKEDYRRRTNRESAAGSREQQKEKLMHYTQQVIRMREFTSTAPCDDSRRDVQTQ